MTWRETVLKTIISTIVWWGFIMSYLRIIATSVKYRYILFCIALTFLSFISAFQLRGVSNTSFTINALAVVL